jgi:CRP-like cAMP-binding protein
MWVNEILQMPIFHGLGDVELANIFCDLKVTETPLYKGDIIARQGEPCNRLILLLNGSVKGEMTDAQGRVVKVEDIEAPAPLAILFLFGTENRFPVQITARENGSVAIISRQAVIKMLSMNEKVLKNYLDISADFATRLSKKLSLMAHHTIRQKLALYLLELSDRQGPDVVILDKSKSALAEYFGVARPSLERELTRMQDEGIFAATDRRRIVIHDRPALIRSAHS